MRGAWPTPELNHPFSHPDQHPQHVERLAAAHVPEGIGVPRWDWDGLVTSGSG